jgi:hypothetical protein
MALDKLNVLLTIVNVFMDSHGQGLPRHITTLSGHGAFFAMTNSMSYALLNTMLSTRRVSREDAHGALDNHGAPGGCSKNGRCYIMIIFR